MRERRGEAGAECVALIVIEQERVIRRRLEVRQSTADAALALRGLMRIRAVHVQVSPDARGAQRQFPSIDHRAVDRDGKEDCGRHSRPQDVLPVRICAHAFGRNAPHTDLLLSPDHAVFTGGVLIPVRYLINGRTIIQQSVAEITYHHVELPAHDVLLAEGLPCESYLDTGNRLAFAGHVNSGSGTTPAPIVLHADFARRVWAAQSCAPLVLEGPPLHATRRYLLGEAAGAGHVLTGDSGLRVIVNGRALRANIEGAKWRVRLPPAARNARLVSRCWVPSQTRADEDDTRTLGVAICNLRLDGQEIRMDDARLSPGWQMAEPDWRWTSGDAGVALAGARDLTFSVAISGTYWTEAASKARVRSA